MTDIAANEGDATANFQIEFSNKLKKSHNIECFFNDKLIDVDDNKFLIEKKDFYCTLIIKNITLEDEGNYTIQCNNAKSSAQLAVNGYYA